MCLQNVCECAAANVQRLASDKDRKNALEEIDFFRGAWSDRTNSISAELPAPSHRKWGRGRTFLPCTDAVLITRLRHCSRTHVQVFDTGRFGAIIANDSSDGWSPLPRGMKDLEAGELPAVGRSEKASKRAQVDQGNGLRRRVVLGLVVGWVISAALLYLSLRLEAPWKLIRPLIQSDAADDIAFDEVHSPSYSGESPHRLHPEDHVYREARTTRYNWNVTLETIRPDGVARPVFHINGTSIDSGCAKG